MHPLYLAIPAGKVYLGKEYVLYEGLPLTEFYGICSVVFILLYACVSNTRSSLSVYLFDSSLQNLAVRHDLYCKLSLPVERSC